MKSGVTLLDSARAEVWLNSMNMKSRSLPRPVSRPTTRSNDRKLPSMQGDSSPVSGGRREWPRQCGHGLRVEVWFADENEKRFFHAREVPVWK